MVRLLGMLVVATAASAGVVCLDVSSSQAGYHGDARWCVMTFGDDIHWDCEFRTAEDCISAATASRGSCNVNPYYRRAPPPTASAMPRLPKQRPRRSSSYERRR
jgi:hypothetical protein